MCLIYAREIEVTKDIVCYKVYLVQNNILVSPYQKSPAPKFSTVAKTDLGQVHGYWNGLEEGFHSYTNLYDALNEAYFWEGNHPVIVKCMIPKGSKCYIGRFSDKASYCSDSIKLIQVIPDHIVSNH